MPALPPEKLSRREREIMDAIFALGDFGAFGPHPDRTHRGNIRCPSRAGTLPVVAVLAATFTA